MTGKLVGAALIITGCSAAGFAAAAAYKREERLLRQLRLILEYMESELQYRMPALPELCRMAAAHTEQELGSIFDAIAAELDRQLLPDAETAVKAALERGPALPESVSNLLYLLGKGLGRFHLSGQIASIQSVQQMCRRQHGSLLEHWQQRLRSCRTLGICAGFGLAILLF